MTKVSSQKYSKALLEVSQEKGQLEAILAEVSEMIQLFEENKVNAFLSSDVYSFAAKSELVDTLLQSSSELMSNFLNTVRANGRLADLAEILEEIKNSADDMFKIADVEVISSIALTDAQIEKFAAMSKSKFDLNEVKVINRVNEKIIGGFIVNSRGKIIDASLKTQLAKIATEIL
jgi:F-type H+-transporting ATPase subunit delta